MSLEEILYWLDYNPDTKILGCDGSGIILSDSKLQDFIRGSYSLMREAIGSEVYLRGLIEISNICRKNCLYCGIRCDNRSVQRYELSSQEVMREAEYARNAGYGSVVIQGGERVDANFVDLISELIGKISKMGLGITLSLGEQSKEVYMEWAKAGAIRYLLRIEASNRELYSKIHPSDGRHSYESRIEALENLKSAGYFVGSGVMIGLPFQTDMDLAHDLLFFKEMNLNMVGMGPYILHPDTPLALIQDDGKQQSSRKLLLSLKMIALLRRIMPWINIASTTALQVLDECGREYGLLSGANVVMPNLTDSNQRKNYQLYSGKPGLSDDADSTKDILIRNLERINISVGWNKQGNPITKDKYLIDQKN